jgi:hypothetical protein
MSGEYIRANQGPALSHLSLTIDVKIFAPEGMNHNIASMPVQRPITHDPDAVPVIVERVAWRAFGITDLAQVCGCAYVDRLKDT